MQTFLPFPDFAESARALDQRRLGKQRVEAMQVLNALGKTTGGWRNHPAVRMWRGYEDALALYTLVVCREWQGRGFADSVEAQILARCGEPATPSMPPWLGDASFHRAHQSNLIRKDAAHYEPLFPGVPGDLPYVWPV